MYLEKQITKCPQLLTRFWYFNLGADTSGTMAIMDLDGDGYQELISAGYSADKVYVHTFSPNPWSNKQTKCPTIKVKTLWEGHKIGKKSPTCFDKTAVFTQ